jgi:hypothetical protein
MRLLTRLTKFLALSSTERSLFTQALVLLPITAAGLRILRFERARSVLMHASPIDGHLVDDKLLLERAYITGRMTGLAVAHSPFPVTCLQQSLALWYLLRRQGIESDFRLGLRKADGQIEGHAWVEVNGRVLSETENVLRQYTTFDSLRFDKAGLLEG